MSTYNNQTGRLSPQSLLHHRYLIVGPAGRGGMGAVYAGIDTHLAQRRVAIKEMSQAHLDEEELAAATARFKHEAHMLGSLSHQNLPHIIDSFSENMRSYLVMDFIDGKTLYQILREAQGKPLPLAQVINYAQQLCLVLAYLHQQNPPIIFRDIKPTNIMITSTGHLFLIDFGIARFFKEGQEHDTMLLGSPGYAPPEQHGSAQTNPRSDIYGLGATLHYCLTGQDPYHSITPFYFAPISQYNPIIPTEVNQLIQRMVAQDERDRPANVQEVLQSIARISQQTREHPTSLTLGTPPTLYAQPAMPALRPDLRNAPQSQRAPQRVADQPTLSPWKTGFIVLVGLILATSLGSSAFALNTGYRWALITESGLALLLALITGIGSLLVQSVASRLLMLLTVLASLVASATFAVVGSKDIHTTLFGSVVSSISSYVHPFNLFSTTLTIAAVLSLYWLLRPFTMMQRILLFLCFGLALACFLMQTSMPIDYFTKHELLLLGLIALDLGALLAIQLERVQKSTQIAMKQAF